MSNSEITIYHNPRCSKSRQTLQILTDKGHSPRIVKYLENTPSLAELEKLVALLGIPPGELVRNTEAEYKQAGLDNLAVDDQAIMQAIVAHPILLQRPIVVRGDRAVIGRPPENVLELLD